MERSERRRKTAADMVRDPPRSPQGQESQGTDHRDLWAAVNEVRGKVNYALGALAVVIAVSVATFIATVAK